MGDRGEKQPKTRQLIIQVIFFCDKACQITNANDKHEEVQQNYIFLWTLIK